MKRFTALMLIVLVSLPWAAFPTARAAACAMPGAKAVEACAYCAPSGTTNAAVPNLEAGCCRFLPQSEVAPAQAGSVGASPRPLQAPDAAAIVPGIAAVAEPFTVPSHALRASSGSPPLATPTRTTHLLL